MAVPARRRSSRCRDAALVVVALQLAFFGLNKLHHPSHASNFETPALPRPLLLPPCTLEHPLASSRRHAAVNRTEASVNKQLISGIFRGIDPFSALPTIQPDWSYRHTNWRPEFFEHVWTNYLKPNHGELEFYLEVGSFKAGSITRLAELLKKKYGNWRKASLVCMDPFTGDVNMWDWNRKEITGHNFLATGSDGRPRIFEVFMANIIDKGHHDMVLPVVVGGLVGMKLLSRLKEDGRINQMPGVIYLDSAHEKDETYLELSQAWEILRECGAIMGDDWSWEAVREDARRFAEDQKLPELPTSAVLGRKPISQPVPGLILGPSYQWFIIKNINSTCKHDKGGTW